jgi:hypothetical protein
MVAETMSAALSDAFIQFDYADICVSAAGPE